MKALRPYQHDAIYGSATFPGILPCLEQHASTLAVLATGLGKTLVIAQVASQWTRGNVLLLAHRIELCDQLADTVAGEIGYRPPVEQGLRGMDPDTLWAAGNVIVGSIQSMITPTRLKKFARHPFGLIVIDEAHRATSPSYVKLVDQYRQLDPGLKLLGVTATPNRTDATALGLVFQSVACEMGIVDGIDQGYLVDVHQKFAVVDSLDLSSLPTSRNEFGETDFQPAKLEALLAQEGPLHEMSRPVLDCTQNGEQAILFTASVDHAHLWAAVLNHYRPGSALAVDGSMPKGEGSQRDRIIRDYKEGRVQFLLNYNIATEGFDAPNTRYVIMGRPTKSRLVYTQMLGRCTRVLPGVVEGLATAEERRDAIARSRKPFATVLDFVGNTELQVVTATDVLGGDFSVDIRKAANSIIGSTSNGGNVRDAVTKARAGLLLAAEEEKRRPYRQVLEQVDLGYRLETVDPFGGSFRHSAPATSRGGSSDAQVAALVNLGVDRDTAQGYSRKQAGAVIDSLRTKRCTVPQAATLRKFGYDPAGFNASEASAVIQQIADNGWRKPS